LEAVPGCVEFYARWDADNNGYYDLFVAGRGTYGQKLFMGGEWGYDLDHTITFLDCQQYGDAGGIDMADLDMDGYAEAIHSGGWDAPNAYLYWGTSSGPDPSSPTLLPMPTPHHRCHETVFTYDLDKDGYLDLTVSGGPSPNYTRIFWGEETFSYSAYTDLPYNIGAQHNLEMADLDHDGWVDAIIPIYGSHYAAIVHFSEGRSYTIDSLDLLPLSGGLHGTSIADFNEDEWLDIVFTGWSSVNQAIIFWGGADGYSEANTLVLQTGTCYGGSSCMDMNFDGRIDLIFHRNGGSSTFPKLYTNLGEDPYFMESSHPDTCRDLGNIPVNGTGGFTADFNYDGYLDIFLNAHSSGNPWSTQSPILWGPDYTTATFLDHDGYDHHGVFREAGNVYDRSFSAWYYSSVFDCGKYYNKAKNAKLTYIGYEPSNSYIDFSLRSGPDSIPDESWTDWDKVSNGYGDPDALRWRYVQYRAEFNYAKPSYLPWLEQVKLLFYLIEFDLILWPDSLKATPASDYVDYFTKLFYLGDERDSFHMTLRAVHNPDWRIELWDTAYVDTIPWYIKLDAIQPQGDDTAFYVRVYVPEDAQVGDSNVTVIYTKTRRCSHDMQDSVILITKVAAGGVYEGRIERPAALTVNSISNRGIVNFVLPAGEHAHLVVYDPTGRRVYAREVEGSGSVQWSDAATPAGLYFVRLESTQGIISRKIVLTR